MTDTPAADLSTARVQLFSDSDPLEVSVVVPAYDEGLEPFGRAAAAQLHSWSGWTSSEDYDWDVAVIDLDWPIGERGDSEDRENSGEALHFPH